MGAAAQCIHGYNSQDRGEAGPLVLGFIPEIQYIIIKQLAQGQKIKAQNRSAMTRKANSIKVWYCALRILGWEMPVP